MAEMVQEATGAENVLWDLSELYKGIDDPAIERDLKDILATADQFAERYRGKVAYLSATELAEAQTATEALSEQFGRMINYASLQCNTDTGNAAFAALLQRMREAGSQLQQKLLFFDLEWAHIPEDHVKIVDDLALARWRHYLLKALDMRPHLLSEPEEKILAEKAVTGSGAWARYYAEVLGAARYDLDGQQVPQEIVLNKLYSGDRDLRRRPANALHPQMAEIAGQFFDKKWIHAPAVPGKRGGAFAAPTIPSLHPYVFLNYTGSDKDVMTLAHELGHGIHMYLSRPKGALEAGTPLTTAEMASVFGEMLVFNDLMQREPDPAVRLSMLARKLEDSFATIFRQISMNRFEDAIHTVRHSEGELSRERYSELWLKTQCDMFQDSVTMRDDYGIWWSYVSHFINVPGYVYAYAFGNLLVLALFNKYQTEGASFAPKYLDVLSSGGADRPENILRKAGVDLTDPNFWQQGLTILDGLVNDLEALVKPGKRQ